MRLFFYVTIRDQLFCQSHTYFKCYRGTTDLFASLIGRKMWIDNCIRGRKYFEWFVMVGNNHIDTELFGMQCFCNRSNPIIYRDNKRTSKLFDLIDMIRLNPISVLSSMWQSNRNIFVSKKLSYKGIDHIARHNPINIIISEDHNLFVVVDSLDNSFDTKIHIFEKKWIHSIVFIGRVQKTLSLIVNFPYFEKSSNNILRRIVIKDGVGHKICSGDKVNIWDGFAVDSRYRFILEKQR